MRRITSIAVVLSSILPVILSQAQSKDATDLAAVKQVEQSMGNAMVAGDIDTLNQIYADDFATFGSSGKTITKRNLVSDFESFHDKLEWFENGPMDVQVFGNVALAQGGVKEKRTKEGKDTSGEFAWMDLLEKRSGKWVVVRSSGARVVRSDSPKAQSEDPGVIDEIKQFERNVGDAMVAFDIDKLNQAYADDWATVTSSGEMFTKQGLLEDFKSGRHKLISFENGPMNVQVLGDVALVQASVNEKRIQDGKDISGDFVFMDLLKKRGGKWVIVRTIGRKVS